jgi:membrane fusion protein (multidrug efflux system)
MGAPTNRLKRMTITLLVVFGGIIVFNLFKAFMIKRFFAHYQPPAVSVASAIAQEVNWQSKINAVGNFVAINGVDLSAQSSGNVIRIDFDSGQFVDKDAPLITIDDSVDQAILKFNQSDLTLKTLNYKRQTDLYKRGATSISSVDEAKATLDQAQAKVDQSIAQIKQKHITAPFSGRLGVRQVNLGQFINPGQTIIVSLQSLDPLYLEFYLPEQLYKKIHPNQSITFSLEEFPKLLFEAKVSAINSKIDLNTHNVLIQGILANCPVNALKDPEHSSLVKSRKDPSSDQLIVSCTTEVNKVHKIRKYAFVPGMFAAIKLDQKIKPHTIIVPSTAISYSLYGNSVYIIEKNKEGMKNKDGTDVLTANRVFVNTGEHRGNYTVIKKGVEAGQLVVSAGEVKLQNNTPIVINNNVVLNDTNNPELLGQ